MKIAIIGAGSTYTPELIEGICERYKRLQADDVALMDIDIGALDNIGAMAERQLNAAGYTGRISRTNDLRRALGGASFVFAQVRPGRMACRILDEKLPLRYGLLGQETTGAGGFMQALRTVPVVMNIAEQMKQLSESGAWLINFSNPSGIVAEAVLNHTGVNMIGLCNCPVNMVGSIADELGTYDFDYEYVGLNHLSWITSVVKHGETENLAPSLAGEADTSMKNNPVANLDEALLRAVPYVPSGYLNYYYMRSEQVQRCLDAPKSRGEICAEIEAELRRKYADPSLETKPPELAGRGGAMYSTAALSAAESIVLDKRERHVVSAKNKGRAVPFMEENDVVEILCEIGKESVEPKPVTVYNEYIVGLMRAVKAYEKLTVRAALEGDRDIALAAMMAHPLIGDIAKAKPLLDEMLQANREHLPNFF